MKCNHNGTRPLHSNQNTMQHLAPTSARKPQHKADSQKQTHAAERHGEVIIREKEEELEDMREVIQSKDDVAARTCG